MCVVSMVATDWTKRLPQDGVWQPATRPYPPAVPVVSPPVTPEEIEEMRQEMRELRKLLLAAKAYDAATGQPDCEMEEKVAVIKKIAEMVGVSMEDVFADHS